MAWSSSARIDIWFSEGIRGIYIVYVSDTKDDNILKVVRTAIETTGKEIGDEEGVKVTIYHSGINDLYYNEHVSISGRYV
jgi:hypothetical protein